jgi:hypothetical protein
MQTVQLDETHRDSEDIGGWLRLGDKPLLDAITEAAEAYRQQRGDRVSTAPHTTIREVRDNLQHYENCQFAAMNRAGDASNLTSGVGTEPSERTVMVRERLRSSHPVPFNIGARCGFYAAEHDVALFNIWSSAERDAFFAGANYGRCQRLRMAAHQEAAE